jgi:hypothetical protein
MKSQILILSILLSIFTSCEKSTIISADDNSSNTEEKKGKDSSTSIDWNSLNSTAIAGKWIVTLFQEDASVQTSEFTGYTFTFNAGNKVTATKGNITTEGNWGYGNDDSKNKLIMSFTGLKPLSELSEDWVIVEQNAKKLRLTHVSGGNGGTDILTFELK